MGQLLVFFISILCLCCSSKLFNRYLLINLWRFHFKASCMFCLENIHHFIVSSKCLLCGAFRHQLPHTLLFYFQFSHILFIFYHSLCHNFVEIYSHLSSQNVYFWSAVLHFYYFMSYHPTWYNWKFITNISVFNIPYFLSSIIELYNENSLSA